MLRLRHSNTTTCSPRIRTLVSSSHSILARPGMLTHSRLHLTLANLTSLRSTSRHSFLPPDARTTPIHITIIIPRAHFNSEHDRYDQEDEDDDPAHPGEGEDGLDEAALLEAGAVVYAGESGRGNGRANEQHEPQDGQHEDFEKEHRRASSLTMTEDRPSEDEAG